MFNLKKNTALWLLALLTLLILSTTACGKRQPKPMLKSKEEKIPKNLNTMQGKSEDIIKEIEKIVEEMKKPEKKEEAGKKEEKGEKSQKGSEGQGSSSDGKKESEQNQQKTSEGKMEGGEEKQKTKQEKIDAVWDKVKKISEEIHTSWGDYEISAIENGIKKQELSKFEGTINNLTVAIDEKNISKSLFYSNEVTYNMATFFDVYKGNHEGELMRIKYFARLALFYGMKGEWNKSEDSIKQAEEVMNTTRAKIKLDKKDQDLMEKMNISIINMKTSIPMKNVELLKIKRDIVLENVDKIKEKL